MSARRRSPEDSLEDVEVEERSRAMASIEAEMSRPIQVCGPAGLCVGEGVERIEPERPEPQPMSRIKEGCVRERRERARWVMEVWIERMREEVVYFWEVLSL
jgi:hypothetical protein